MRFFAFVFLAMFASQISNAFANDEYRITNKGCREYLAPKWFIEKYGANNGVVFLTAIKDTIVSEEIIKSQKCDCTTLYIPWASPIKIYEQEFEKLDAYAKLGSDTQKFLSKYRSTASANISAARKICKAQGVL